MSALIGVGPRAAPGTTKAPADRTRELYESYGQRVFTFCYSRLRDREEAQDATQTTFIYVLRSLERGVVPEFELAWVLKIAFNVCRSTRRSSRRYESLTQDVAAIDELPDSATRADGFDDNERLEALRSALRTLPETQRRAVLLREWQGLSYAEIGDELGLTVGAVETLLFRARQNLTARLDHVRGGLGSLDVAALVPLLRTVSRGALAKLALMTATASVAVVPLAAETVLQARAAHTDPRPLKASATDTSRSLGNPSRAQNKTGQVTKTRRAPVVTRVEHPRRHTRPRSRAVEVPRRGGPEPAAPAADRGSRPASEPFPGPPESTPPSLQPSPDGLQEPGIPAVTSAVPPVAVPLAGTETTEALGVLGVLGAP